MERQLNGGVQVENSEGLLSAPVTQECGAGIRPREETPCRGS